MKQEKTMGFVWKIVFCLLVVTLVPSLQVQAAGKNASNYNLKYVEKVFDAEYYYNQNADVAAAIGQDTAKLLKHYTSYGIKEGRNASATFNATTYKYNYMDLQVAFGEDITAYCKHYVEYGMAEGRNAIDQLVAPPATANTGNVIATYSTVFDAKIARATNVKLAAVQINGIVLQPGQEFSFLNSLTPRTLENGYVVAPVYSGGKVSKGVGGGICQVSSTLYAAVLGTDCTVTERHRHSLPVAYIPTDKDATVASPNLDFRFVNTYEQPMLLSANAGDDGVLTVNISLQ